MAMEGLAKAVEAKKIRKYKPQVSVGVSVDTRDSSSSIGGPRTDWRKEEHDRLVAEVAALEKELKAFDPKEAAEKVRRSLDIKLKLKKLRLDECKLKLDNNGLSDY